MSGLWRIALTVPAKACGVVADALSAHVSALTVFEDGPGDAWTLEGIAETEPQRPALIVALALAAATIGTPPPDTVIEPLAERDWLALNRRSFPPIREGRVWLRGSHIAGPAPAATLALRVDAARAFGSGSHATTALCLAALQDLVRRRQQRQPLRAPIRALDLGCGSGVLAMALAGLVPSARILAVDLDPVAVATASRNCRLNGLRARVRTHVANGWCRARVQKSAPFDLVLANILARPLVAMAPGLRRGLAPGGFAILSGLLVDQEALVLSAHRAQRLHLVRRYHRDGWSALVLRRNGRNR